MLNQDEEDNANNDRRGYGHVRRNVEQNHTVSGDEQTGSGSWSQAAVSITARREDGRKRRVQSPACGNAPAQYPQKIAARLRAGPLFLFRIQVWRGYAPAPVQLVDPVTTFLRREWAKLP
jgi:hypothetical protein